MQAFFNVEYGSVSIVRRPEGVVGVNVILGDEGYFGVVVTVIFIPEGEFLTVGGACLHMEADRIFVRPAGTKQQGSKEKREQLHTGDDKRFIPPGANQ